MAFVLLCEKSSVFFQAMLLVARGIYLARWEDYRVDFTIPQKTEA